MPGLFSSNLAFGQQFIPGPYFLFLFQPHFLRKIPWKRPNFETANYLVLYEWMAWSGPNYHVIFTIIMAKWIEKNVPKVKQILARMSSIQEGDAPKMRRIWTRMRNRLTFYIKGGIKISAIQVQDKPRSSSHAVVLRGVV